MGISDHFHISAISLQWEMSLVYPLKGTLSKDSLDIFKKFFPLVSVDVTGYNNSKDSAGNLIKSISTHLEFSHLIVRSINTQCTI